VNGGGAPGVSADAEVIVREVARLLAGGADGYGSGGASGSAAAALAGLDSIGRLDLLAVIEERFEVELSEDLVAEFESPGRVARIIRDARAAGGEPGGR
jgi:hypothetical protein